MNSKKKIGFCLFVSIVLVTLVFVIWFLNPKNNQQKSNYVKVINPYYLNYNELSDNDGLGDYISPDKDNIVYTGAVNTKSNIDLPSSFDLRSVNNKRYITNVKNQGSRGLCWAFTTTSLMESSLLYFGQASIDNPIVFSPFQIDYATSRNGIIDYYEYNRELEGGWYSYDVVEYMTKGLSPLNINYFNEDVYDNKKLNYNDVFHISDMQYYFPNYYILVADNELSRDDVVKKYIMENGAAYVSSLAPSLSKMCEQDGKVLLDSNVNCNQQSGHAMTVIGWDDNIEFNINNKKIKGAWLVQNSWGESLPYIYIGYNSASLEFYGYGKGNEVDYNNVYVNPVDIHEDNNVLINNFVKSNNSEETIKRLSFSHHASDDNKFNIYLSKDGGEYVYLDQVMPTTPGRTSIDLTNDKYNVSTLILDGERFSIKIVSEVENSFHNQDIYVFTQSEVVDENDYSGYIVPQTDDIYYYSKKFDINVVMDTRISKNDISLKIFDDNNVEISNDELSLYSINRRDQMFSYTYNINQYFLTSKYVVKLYYKGELIDTADLNIESLEPISEYGDGTKDNPFIIMNSEQFAKIASNSIYYDFSYALGDDIDLSNYADLTIGTEENPFTGSFDGNGYIISNYRINDSSKKYSGLFDYTMKATIHDVILKNFYSSVTKSGFLVGKDNGSEIYNIYVDGGATSKKIMSFGSIAFSGKNGEYYSLYSSATIGAANGGGLFGKLENSSVSFAVFNGELDFSSVNASAIVCSSHNSYFSYIDVSYINHPGGNFSSIVSSSMDDIYDNIFLNVVSDKNIYFIISAKRAHINNIYIYDDGKYLKNIKDDDESEINNIVVVEKSSINNNSDLNSKFNLNLDHWVYVNNVPRVKHVNYNFNSSTPPGVSNNYKFDTINHIIYNVRMPSENVKLTRKHFIENFTVFNAKIYSPDDVELVNDDDIITTGTKVKTDKYTYYVAIMGNTYDSFDNYSVIDIGDAVAGQRFLAKYSVDIYGYNDAIKENIIKYAGDLDCDGSFNIGDITILRRRLAALPSKAIYESDGMSCYEFDNGDVK